MSVKSTTDLQRVLVFVSDHPSVANPDLSALKQIFPRADLTIVDPAQAGWLLQSQQGAAVDWSKAVAWLQQHQLNAVMILTAPGQSPYTLGYLCYLAGIPIRIGHSHEFGGQVLSHCSPPPEEGDCKQLLALLGEIARE